nr:pyridine nucleotide-disulfide oxidoreductase [Mycobacterium sp.]
MSRLRVVVAGLGDSGLLTAIRLARAADVVGISVNPGLVSGQELGVRLTRPADWARDYLVPFDRYRALDRVRTVQAELTWVDLNARTVSARQSDGSEITEPYDALIISTGVSNGFWRRPVLQTPAEVRAEIAAAHDRLARAASVIVIGGGAAAVSAAANIAARWPATTVDLYFPHDRALRDHHPRTWDHLQ